MISILIPTYNYDIVPLVNRLHEEARDLDTLFEIIVLDDASDMKFQKENSVINLLENCSYTISEKNQGRSKTRNDLAKKAQYDWLLFLDADVIPKNKNFVKKYVAHLHNNDIIFGGISYLEKRPPKHEILRWKYGKEREGKSVAVRKKMPYLSIISQSFLIKKEVFKHANPSTENGYGMDVLFSTNLESMNVKVLHIDNPIIHNGLESSSSFIEKTNNGIDTMIRLEREQKISEDYRPIQKAFLKLKKYHATRLFQVGITIFKPCIKKNLVSSHPSLFLFDLYKLNYYIKLKKKHA